MYSLVNIPYGSLASAVSQSVHQRAKLVAARTFGAGLGTVILTWVIGDMVNGLRAQKQLITSAHDLAAYQAAVQGVFTKVTLAFIVIGTLAFWFTAWVCREKVVRTQTRVSVRETLDTIRSNKPLAYLCGSSFFYLIGLFAVGGATAFYAQYVLGKVTQSIRGALGAWALTIGGYVAAGPGNRNPIQPDSAIIAIKVSMGLIPAAAALITMVIFIKYPLTDEKSKQIRNETDARKQVRLTVPHREAEPALVG